MLLVPIAALAVFSAMQVAEKRGVVASMAQLKIQVKLADNASALAHSLQKERGQSAGFLASTKNDDDALRAQQAESDKAAATLDATLNELAFEGEVAREVEELKRRLQNLAAQRNQVLGRSATPEVTIRYYTDLISSPLALIGHIAHGATDPEIAIRLVAVESLVRMKELSGQERAVLAASFNRGSATRVEVERAQQLAGGQLALEQLFARHTPSDILQTYRSRMEGAFSESLNRHRAAIAASTNDATSDLPSPLRGNDSKDGDSSAAGSSRDALALFSGTTWWEATTARIDALFEVERAAVQEVINKVTERDDAASTSMILVVVFALAFVLGAMAAAVFLGRGIIMALGQASDALQKVVAQVGAFIHQQTAVSGETAVSVSETTATVEEIRRTAEAAEKQAKDLSLTSRESRSASDNAIEAVSQGIKAMQHIRKEVESIAQSILELSEKNIQVAEIVQSVNAIAEQSNLLAVNASIEAAKAGDHGRGFSVVASEVKALAQQSREATEQIRLILAEVQKSSNGAVMITEQGVKRVEEGAVLIEELGRSIEAMSTAMNRASDAAEQVSMIAVQQLGGIQQISEAMSNLDEASRQTADGAVRLGTASDEVKSVGNRINEIVKGQTEAA